MARTLVTLVALATMSGMALARADAQAAEPVSSVVRQSPGDAWWTGPMLANSAATLPRGHFLLEPYLYDVASIGRYDQDGVRRHIQRSDSFGSQTYILYGLADRVSVGVIPNLGFNTMSGGRSSAHVGVGDLGVMAQYRITRMDPYSSMPTISINVQETLPTGRYDRLGSRAADGFGSGAYTTTLSLYSQKYFWMPTGRILRMRLNVSQAFSNRAALQDESVYGTDAGFRGNAQPGQSLFVNGAWEYSVTRRWVLALDATYRHARSTEITGSTNPASTGAPPSTVVAVSGPSDAVGLAPAVEYNWTSNVGVLFGTRVIVAGRNTTRTVSPAIAFNIVH